VKEKKKDSMKCMASLFLEIFLFSHDNRKKPFPPFLDLKIQMPLIERITLYNAMPTPPFYYQKPFELGADRTAYRLLTKDFVSTAQFEGKDILKIEADGLRYLARQAMRDVSFFLRPAHLKQVAAILDDPEASENDRNVALTMLLNAEVSAQGVLPFCQDTGTATVVGKKGQQVWTTGNDEEAISEGIFETYTQENLRYSQVAPLTMYDEKNTGTNLPAQIDLYATKGESYEFVFVAKGGGSANKTYLYQETKALLNPESLEKFMLEKMTSLGTAACPPYHLVFVIGGTSAESCLKTVKLASTKYLDTLPTSGNAHGRAFRDVELEQRVLKMAQECGIGAQFGGKYFALDVTIVRLPRHGASCPVGIGVSCSADRNIRARINKDGIWLEQLEYDPSQYIPAKYRIPQDSGTVKIDLNRPMKEILAELSKHPVKTRLSLTGTIVVARDIAHAKLKERIDKGEGLPEYVKNHPIYYAGPAKTPAGMPSGSFGPTTAGRMDSYVDNFQSHGGSLLMIAKGNRSQQVTDACKKFGGFYLGSIGGPAAILAKENIKKVETLEYPELGMEAIWKIEVVDFPAFILVDDKGNDFFKQLSGCSSSGCH
jgi:fumarate hydratase class I